MLPDPGLSEISEVRKSQKAKTMSTKHTHTHKTCWRVRYVVALNNNQNQSRNVHLLGMNQRERKSRRTEEQAFQYSLSSGLKLHTISRSRHSLWFSIITSLEATQRNGKGEKEGNKCWRTGRVRGGREWEERKEITLRGEMEDKRRERWSGRMAEQGSFSAAALLNSAAGVQRGCACVCMCVWQIGSLITREKGFTYVHTHKENTHKHAHSHVHWGWHFLSAPLFPRPGSPWHQRQQHSLPAGGEEWKELMEGGEARTKGGGGRRSGGNRKKADAKAGTLIHIPPIPPTSLLCEWIEIEITQPDSTVTVSWVWNPK